MRKPKPHGAVVAWLSAIDDVHLHLSAVTIAEKVHSLTVVTRNVADFKPLGVAVLDPFKSKPGDL